MWGEAHEVLDFRNPLGASSWACPEQAVMGRNQEPRRILPVDGKFVNVRLARQLRHAHSVRCSRPKRAGDRQRAGQGQGKQKPVS